ncbi:hypothetical protein GPECTOR_4g882 [Gonium pectorale]|uniref:BTB domain-containing protein n=1 Tax=Gonium pectorale TaxID=33097 RepID=A0A150GYA5_GONPE|nr:hypothetical protein GPECTOR_4g882 [Gonium pectorale]|eukprot:KXZ54811.1 hypothetical protein GPECTOR_4g882 [Gonium pectorale]
MANLGDVRRAAFGRAQGAQHYASHFLGLNAAERHKKLVNDYLTYYARGGDARDAAGSSAPVRTDADALVEHHRFIRDDNDDSNASWEVRLAKRYYDRLFKEYAIVDLTQYKQSKLGMRWRTAKEVMAGKGQFVCGAKGCDASDGLCSYEINFAYQEAGERKQALVKLRVCPACAFKLNYRKEKALAKAADAAAARKRKREAEEAERAPADPRVREALEFVQKYAKGGPAAAEGIGAADLERAAGDVAPPPAAAAGTAGGAVAAAAGVGEAAPPAIITLPADNSVWEAKPAQEAVSETFEVGTYLWKLLCFPKQNKQPYKYVSVFLGYPEAMFAPHNLSPKATFKLTIKNHKDPKKDFFKDSTHTFVPEQVDWGFSHMLPLVDLNMGYLRDDGTLVIHVEVQVENPLYLRFSASTLSRDFLALLDSPGATSDLTLLAGGRSFPVHRLILTARCPYFKTLFESGFGDRGARELKLGDADPGAVALLLRSIYGGAAACPSELLKPAAELADQWLMTETRDGLYEAIAEASSSATITADLLWAESRDGSGGGPTAAALLGQLEAKYVLFAAHVTMEDAQALAESNPELAGRLLVAAAASRKG